MLWYNSMNQYGEVYLVDVITYFGEGFDCNSYLVTEENNAVLIDCAVSIEKVKAALTERGATLRYIILTHGHFDHILTLDEMRDATDAKVVIHQNDAEMLTDGMKNGYCDFFHGTFSVKPADMTVTDGDVITAGNINLKVIHTPGHSKGSMCLECKDHLFTGDTLFANNIGRSDLYGGDGRTILKSLKKLAAMRHELEIYPGHGPVSTIEREVRCNYYIRDALNLD